MLKRAAGLIIFLSFSCNETERGPESSLDFFDQKLAAEFDLAKLRPEQIKDICGRDSIFVFVGNGEEMGSQISWHSDISAAQIAAHQSTLKSNHQKFMTSILKAEADLLTRLSQNPCGTNSSRTALVSVIDEDGMNNSSIRVATWVYENGILNKGVSKSVHNRSFQNNALGAAELKFELFMPTDLEQVIRAIGNEYFRTWVNPQVSVFMKTHGARMENAQARTYSGVLFDRYGSDGIERLSKFYDKSWLFQDIDKGCKDFRTKEAPGSRLYAFCEIWADESLSTDKLRGTQGRTGEGRTGEGRTGEGRTGEGRTGEGRTGEGRTGEGRSGEGVGSLTTQRPEILQAAFDINTAQGVYQIAAFGTYHPENVDLSSGVYSFRWPLPKYTKEVPVYLLFDSCSQGLDAYRLMGSASNKDQTQLGQVQVPVIGRSSMDSVEFEEIDYLALSSMQYRALPHVIYWAKNPRHPMHTPEIKDLSNKIDSVFADRHTGPRQGVTSNAFKANFREVTGTVQN
jgi:hypothetical protein